MIRGAKPRPKDAADAKKFVKQHVCIIPNARPVAK